MRRSYVSILVLVLAFGLAAAMPPAGASLQKVPSGPAYRGLIRNPDGICGPSLFQVAGPGKVLCTHGPDPLPMGAVAHGSPSVALMRARAGNRPTDVPCVDNGNAQSGDRIQAVYLWATGQPDRFSSLLPSLQTYAADVEATVEQSAQAAGGQREFRWVTASSAGTCQPSFLDLEIPASDIGSFAAMEADLQKQGYNLATRKYLIWVDFPGPMQNDTYCGIGSTYTDDRPDPSINLNNGHAAQYAGIQPMCWGLRSTAENGSVESHEVMHTLGAVQNSAPDSTGAGHCTDDYDVMCYQDTSGITPTIVCPSQSSEDLYDCNFNDYFNPNPTGSNYLITHWNTANSSWMFDPNAQTHQLSVHFSGSGGGTVSGAGLNCTADCSAAIPEGSKVTLTANPDTTSTFTSWSGGGCSGRGSCSFTMGTSDVLVTASFGVRPQFQPDLWIKAGSGKFLGNNVYTSNGTGETAAATGGRGTKKVFTIYLEIDGAAASDTMHVAGPGSSPGFKVRYSSRGNNLSAPNGALAVKLITLNQQQYAVLTLTVTILSTAAHGAVKAMTVTATSQHASSAKDAVKAKVSVL